MKVSNVIESTAATFSSCVMFLAAVSSPAIATVLGQWEPVTVMEHVFGAAGGLLGGLAYANARKMTQPVTVITSAALAIAWCAIFAPIATHLVAVAYPQLEPILIEPLITAGVGAVMGCCGMVLYEALLRALDALAKALPDTVEDLLGWIVEKLTGIPRKKDE